MSDLPVPTDPVAAGFNAAAQLGANVEQVQGEMNSPDKLAEAKAKARQELMDQINALIADDLAHPNDTAKLNAIRQLLST